MFCVVFFCALEKALFPGLGQRKRRIPIKSRFTPLTTYSCGFWMVPTTGFEPATYSLRMSCSTSWAKSAYSRTIIRQGKPLRNLKMIKIAGIGENAFGKTLGNMDMEYPEKHTLSGTKQCFQYWNNNLNKTFCTLQAGPRLFGSLFFFYFSAGMKLDVFIIHAYNRKVMKTAVWI